MPDLSHFLALSDVQPFYDDACSYGHVTDHWRKRYFRRLETIVHPRLGAFFQALKTEGSLKTIPNSHGYSCRRWNAWNAVAALTDTSPRDEWDQALNNLAEQFAHRFVFDITYPYGKILRDHGAEAAQAFDKSGPFNEEVRRFNTGDFEAFHFSHESCSETDLPLTLRFTNWVPEGCYITDKGTVPVPPLEPASMQETLVVLKTGNLLVSDWFRIPEFTEVVEKSFALNARRGREDQTRFYAEKFGFVSVCVGNSSPGVYQDGSTVVVGYHDEDETAVPANLNVVGRVCTDLWAATFVEYETLVEIVARKLPVTAQAVVDDYLGALDKGSYGLHKMKVEPGTYYLYHYGDHERFAEMAQTAGIPLERYIGKPYFILSQERLLPEACQDRALVAVDESLEDTSPRP